MRNRFFSYSFFISAFCFFSTSCFAQNNSELTQLADNAFAVGDYGSAAYFYKTILANIDSGKVDLAIPYEIVPFSKPPKPEKDTSALKKGNPDSAATATTSAPKNIVTNTDSSSNGDVHEESAQVIYLMEQLALSYRLSHGYDNSEIWYHKLFDMKTPNAAFEYGTALLLNGKYAEARKIITDYMLEIEPSSDYFKKSKSIIQKCAFGEKAIKKPNKDIGLQKADSTINTGGAFAVSYVDESSVIFTSSRPTPNSQSDCNLYKASFNENGKMSDVTNFKFPPSSNNYEHNDGACALSPDGSKLFFTRWSYDEENPGCAIYVSKFLNGQWLTPRKLNDKINMPEHKSMHPALSPDGSTLYFVSDRPDGVGKLDIWYCTLDEADNTEEVKNLGPNINTAENDVTPFFHGASNTFYYSSDGKTGMGGLDIFKTSIENGFNGYVENLGSPLNSSRDDAYYIASKDLKRGFLSSDREACATCGEGNCYQIYSFSNNPTSIIITISGKVFNEETKEPVVNSMVAFTDVQEEHEPIYVFTDDKGAYKATLNRNVEYFATAQSAGFFKASASLNTLNIDKSTDLIQDWNFKLKSIPKGDIVIPGIEYDLGKATLRPEAKKNLDELVEFLKLNDNLIIEISSHTDSRGSAASNLKLSEARAKSVSDYLIAGGIPAERLTSKGYGFTQLLVPNAKTEEEHQKNRRTAFRTLSEDFKPTNKVKYLPKK